MQTNRPIAVLCWALMTLGVAIPLAQGEDAEELPSLGMGSVTVTSQRIFSGEIDNWQEVGGPNQPIVVVTRLHCKKRPGHWKTILPSHKEFRQERLNVKSAAAMVQRVNDFQGAIGHTGATWKFKADDKVKVVSVNGIKPTAENLANGKYPFYRQMSAITNRDPSPDVVKLIKEAQTGPAFRKVAKKYELLPLNPLQP